MENFRLGVVCDSVAHIESLQKLLSGCGFNVVVATHVNSFDVADAPKVDAWVVRLDLNLDDSHSVYELLEDTGVAVIIDDGQFVGAEDETIAEQKKRFVKKIYECVGRQYLESEEQSLVTHQAGSSSDEGKPAEFVWILAASTGGPEAVNAFLGELDSIPDNTSFLYVQHIDSSMHESLIIMLKKHKYLKIEKTIVSKRILGGRLYLINPDEQIDISQAGVIIPTSNAWQGIYKPSIDQVMAKTARCFKNRCGAIIFSGMGNDGAGSCRFFTSYGGALYIQSPESCTIDSMPVCASEVCDVTYQGTPGQLAQQFAKSYELVT